ncbi:MAG TPA: hypothetical protein VNB06_22940, partial [Thermoanaerobaculia bacterium]|nr:hypothetical protein [Thermoanaerobaculia bacterium]
DDAVNDSAPSPSADPPLALSPPPEAPPPTVIEHTIVERIIERTPVFTTTTTGGLTEADLTAALAAFREDLEPDFDIARRSPSRSSITLNDASIPDDLTVSNYLHLGGGTLTGALVGTDGSFTTLGVGTTSPSDMFALTGAALLAQITAPSVTTDRLYNTSGDLYWAGSVIGGATTGQWTTDGTHVWRASGKVGVATSSPWGVTDGARIALSEHEVLRPPRGAGLTG